SGGHQVDRDARRPPGRGNLEDVPRAFEGVGEAAGVPRDGVPGGRQGAGEGGIAARADLVAWRRVKRVYQRYVQSGLDDLLLCAALDAGGRVAGVQHQLRVVGDELVIVAAVIGAD